VSTGPQGIADDGVLIDTGQAGGLANATAVLEVLENGHGPVVRQPRAEQSRAFPFGKAILTGAAGEQAALALAVAEGDAEVAAAAQAVVGAGRVLAAEQVKVFHEDHRSVRQQDAGQRLLGIVEIL
jgi:hypothetical protein